MANKPDAPIPAEPAVSLGDQPQALRGVPEIDLKALYEWNTKLRDFKVVGKLVTFELSGAQRLQSGGGRMLFDLTMESRINELMLAYGPLIFSKPVAVDVRLRKLREIDALETSRGVVEHILQQIADTILIRREQLGRETSDIVSALIELFEGGQLDAFAAGISVESLKERQAKLLQSQRAELARLVNSRVSESTTDLGTQLGALQAENQRLRAQLDAMSREAVKAPVATPPVTPERRGDSR